MRPTLSAACTALLLACQDTPKDDYNPDECQDGDYLQELLVDTLTAINSDELCNAFDDPADCLVPSDALDEAREALISFSDEDCVTAETYHPEHARYQVFAIDFSGENSSLYLTAHPDLISMEGFDGNGQSSYAFTAELIDGSRIEVNSDTGTKESACGSCVSEERNFEAWLTGLQSSFWELERSPHNLDGYTQIQF